MEKEVDIVALGELMIDFTEAGDRTCLLYTSDAADEL